jgi:thiol-disulfide isomerase/thioredoxin
MIKVIFLDIDGVLNSHEYWVSERYKTYNGNIETHPNYEISPDLVDTLNKIIEATKAKIVVSSTWRSRMKETKKAKEFFMNSVVIFSGKDCVPCKQLKDQLQNKSVLGMKNLFYYDVEQQQDLANKYEVKSVPATVYLNDAGVFNVEVGVRAGIVSRIADWLK